MPDNHVVIFTVGDRRCALPCSDVREVLPVPRLWQPPGLPPGIAGMLMLAGSVVPVIALGRLFGLGTAPDISLYAHLLLLSANAPPPGTALLVDRVLDIAAVPQEQRSEVEPGKTLNDCVTAEITLGGALVHLLAAERILLVEERERVEALARAMADRVEAWSTSV